MNKFLLGAATTLAAFAIAPAATAATFMPGTPQFQVTFKPNGTISARIGVDGLSGPFDDTYQFELLTNGIGSGGVIATFSGDGNFFEFGAVSINGVPILPINSGGVSVASANNVSLMAGTNRIRIAGNATGNVAYAGVITFVPNAVPEPATWAMMLVGFGMVGSAMRYRRRATKVVYA
ncbi:FxDxF family PEP-CTERM protein [Sphingomonas sp. Tas61C01]|uniref:FxDxF family PEP-CTERM protein n=1 Tax=Sphingomonas sp. Tas61C01 TaxID=3458297 RepID=UPI00403E61F2